jgi:hypothetical protein
MSVTPIAWAVMDMAQHARENPTHGYNCACKDRMISRVHRTITREEADNLIYLAQCIRNSHINYPIRSGRSKVSGT